MRLIEVIVRVYFIYYRYLKLGAKYKKVRDIRLKIDKLSDIVLDCEKNEDYYAFFRYSTVKWFYMSVYCLLVPIKAFKKRK